MEKVIIRDGEQIWCNVEYGNTPKLGGVEFVEYSEYEELLESKHSLQQVITRRLEYWKERCQLLEKYMEKATDEPKINGEQAEIFIKYMMLVEKEESV